MFIALYRWSLKQGQEDRFREGWRRLTEEIYRQRGSHGSRLHRAEDGAWVAYAQWPDRQAWAAAHGTEPMDGEASKMMRESVETSHPPILMEVVDDLLRGDDDGASSPEQSRA